MTLQEALDNATQKLETSHITNSAYDAFAILEFVTGISKKDYILRRSEEVSNEDATRYQVLIDRRANHIPLQHITNCQNFYGYDFYVDENVLVPRHDTEVLVEQVLKLVNTRQISKEACGSVDDTRKDITILDICTGSGCIAIAMYLELTKKGKIPKVVATDISDKALEVASRNANVLIGDGHLEKDYFNDNNNFRLIQSDIFDNIDSADYDIIVSNPPYIPTEEIEELDDEVRLHDPFVALDGDEDGLKFYNKIIDRAPQYLRSGGYLCFEIGYNQGEAIASLMNERGFVDINIYKDLAGLDRVIIGRME